MPVYNGEQFLRTAIESIRAQTFTDFEVIISDNASTDSTGEICREYADRDERIRYVRQPENLGGSPNFNAVVHLANADYFKWATHDDVIAPTFLEVCVAALDTAPSDVALVYPKTILIDAEGDEIEPFDDLLDLRDPRPSARLRRYLENYRLSNAVHGLHRLDTLRQTRLLGAYHSSDLVLLAEIVLLGQIWELPEPLFYRRWHDGMSRVANVRDEEVIAWFDPKKSTDHPMPRTRLFAEDARSIATADLPIDERARALWALAAVWGPRHWRTIGGEFKRELKGLVRRSG
jgi:glycosyltransferase involved in cell wall biosynthesis